MLELLNDTSIWKSLFINYHHPYVERVWCQLGNYRIYLHFIHTCTTEESLFHPHPWPSAIHVIEGEYEMGMGFGPGIEKPEVFSTILSQGNMYYDMSHIDGWHYVRPTKSVCSSVMLVGQPWERELPDEKVGTLESLSDDRVYVILNYFKTKFTVIEPSKQDTFAKGDWVMLDADKMNSDDREEYGVLIGKKGFVIKNTINDGLSIRFDNDRYDEFNEKVLKKLYK